MQTLNGKTLINFSGGTNSSLMLIWALKINPANTVVVHYCEVQNNLNSWEQKTNVVNKMVQRLQEEGHEFQYIQTGVNIKNIPFSYDLVHVFGMAGAICQSNRDIDEVHFGFIDNDDYGGFDYDETGHMYGFEEEDPVEIIYPMFEMTKEDISLAIISEGYPGEYNK